VNDVFEKLQKKMVVAYFKVGPTNPAFDYME
jgi:hypothetical protein